MSDSPELLPEPDEPSSKGKNTLLTGEAKIASDFARRERELAEKVRTKIASLPKTRDALTGLSNVIMTPRFQIREGDNGELDIFTSQTQIGGTGSGRARVNLDTNDLPDNTFIRREGYPYRLRLGIHMDQATMEEAQQSAASDPVDGADFTTTYFFSEEDGKIEKFSTVPAGMAVGRSDIVDQNGFTATFPSPMTHRDFEMSIAAIGALEEAVTTLHAEN